MEHGSNPPVGSLEWQRQRCGLEVEQLEEQQAQIEEDGMLELRETIEEKIQQSAADLENAAPNVAVIKDRIEVTLRFLY